MRDANGNKISFIHTHKSGGARDLFGADRMILGSGGRVEMVVNPEIPSTTRALIHCCPSKNYYERKGEGVGREELVRRGRREWQGSEVRQTIRTLLYAPGRTGEKRVTG